VVTRRDLLNPQLPGTMRLRELPKRPPVVVYSDCTLREAADHMVNHDIGRLPVIDRATTAVVGMITRSDLLSAHRHRLRESARIQGNLRFRRSSSAQSLS
jgi:CBS domain-containing protein